MRAQSLRDCAPANSPVGRWRVGRKSADLFGDDDYFARRPLTMTFATPSGSEAIPRTVIVEAVAAAPVFGKRNSARVSPSGSGLSPGSSPPGSSPPGLSPPGLPFPGGLPPTLPPLEPPPPPPQAARIDASPRTRAFWSVMALFPCAQAAYRAGSSGCRRRVSTVRCSWRAAYTRT